MTRFEEFIDIWRHKKAFMKTRKESPLLTRHISWFRAINHDLLKSINVLLIGDRLASKLHRKYAGHHARQLMNNAQKYEAFCDWECARFTKPDKQLNGEETWKKYFPDIEMYYIIHLWKEEQNL